MSGEPGLPRDLIDAAADKRLIPFVGAGVSRAVLDRSGKPLFPSWKELMERAVRELEENKLPVDASLVSALISKQPPNYLEAAKYARDGLRNLWPRLLKSVFSREESEADPNSFELGRAIWGLESPLLVTTNYDDSLAWASFRPPRRVHIEDGGVLGDAIADRITKATVWHLHGSIDKPGEVILTPGGYGTLYGSPGVEKQYEAALTTLRALFAGKTFLFVGFSYDDEAVAEEIEWVNSKFGTSARQHYILVREKESGRVSDRVSENVRVIAYSEHGQPLIELLRELARSAAVVKPAEERDPNGKYRIEHGDQRRDARCQDLAKICEFRYGRDRAEQFYGPPPFREYVRVLLDEQRDAYLPVAFTEQPVDVPLIQAFADKLLSPARARFSRVRGRLVYESPAPADEIRTQAESLGIDLTPLSTFEEVIDFGEYLDRQRALFTADTVYPPKLFVPQRFVLHNEKGRPATDAVGALHRWIEAEGGQLIVVLGAAGTGKTFLLREYARTHGARGARVAPIWVPLRELEKAHSLDQLLAAHFARDHVLEYRPAPFRYLLEKGRIALLFDGFDELALRVPFESAAYHLGTLTGAVSGKAKVVVTSRTEHFLTTDQVLTPLGKGIERAPHRLAELLSFDVHQVKHYLVNSLGTEKKAVVRQMRMDDVPDISGLAEIPRLLSFVTQEVSDEDLIAAKARGERVNAAELYERLLSKWLTGEREIAEPRGARPGLSVAQRWRIAENLALNRWLRVERTIGHAELRGIVEQVLEPADRARLEELLQEFAGRSLLRREGDDAFTFIHQSVLEWLVARAAARELNELGTSNTLGLAKLSELMIAFLWDLAGPKVEAWCKEELRRSGGGHGKDNALALLRARGIQLVGNNLAGQSLGGGDHSGEGFVNADLRGADLSRARLVGAKLMRAQLDGASLVRVEGQTADLTDASLEDADLSFANLMGARLLGARVSARTRLHAAKLIGSVGGTETLRGTDAWGAAADGAVPEPVIAPPFGGPLAISPDGRWLAVAGSRAISVLDFDRGVVVRLLEGHTKSVLSVAFSPDGRSLASGADDKTVRLWDLASGKARLLEGHTNSMWSVAFSPDGRSLASGADDKTVRLWDLASGKARLLEGHTKSVLSVAFSPDGCSLASGADDKTVRLWDLASGKARLLEGHTKSVWSVAFSPDGRSLASGADKTVRLWDLASGKARLLEGHTNSVRSVAFSPNGRSLASGAVDKTVRLWDLASGKARLLKGHMNSVRSVAFSPDGRSLASGGNDNTVRLWDLASRKARLLEGHTNSMWSVAFSPDSRSLASGGNDNTVRLWDLASGKARLLEGHTKSVRSVAFSPDGRSLASGANDNTVRLWDLASGEARLLWGHTDWVRSIAFSPDGRSLASSADDKTVRLWDLASGKARLLEGQMNWVRSVAFSPGGRSLALGADDYTVHLWDLASGKTRLLEGHTDSVRSVAFSPDGRSLASGADDKTVRLWDLASGKARLLERHTSLVGSVAFSPDGRSLASGADDNTVRLWDLASGKARLLEGHADSVRSVAFSPDGRSLVSGAHDNTVRLWDLASGTCIAVLASAYPLDPFDAAMGGAPNGSVAFRPDGRYRIHGDVGNAFWHVIGLCRFEPGELDPYMNLRMPDDEPLLAR